MIENNENNVGYRIRKLTPKECWRLMGFTDRDFYAAKTGSKELSQKIIDTYPHQDKKQTDEAVRLSKMSNTQLYKQAGNSIVVDVLYYIFKELYEAMPYLFEDLKVGSYFSGIGAFESGLDRLYTDINQGVNQNTPNDLSQGGLKRWIYDDYNSNVRKDQNTIGTITTQIGSSGLRKAYKLIEEKPIINDENCYDK